MKDKIFKAIKKFNILNFLGLTVAGIINAVGVTMFLAPVNLYDSGISGTSILLSQVTPEKFTLSVFLVILNIPLFLYGLKTPGINIYCLCYFYGCGLFVFRLSDYRCFTR